MTGAEMERAIEFLLRSQANSEARIGRLEAAQEETTQQIRGLTGNLDRLADIVAQNSVQIERNSVHIGHLNRVMAELAEGQQRSKDNVDVLVKLVGGLIEGRDREAN